MKSYKKFLDKIDTAGSSERLDLFVKEYKRHKEEHRDKKLKLLDIGCGKNAYLFKKMDKKDEYFGCDYYDKISVKIPHYTAIDLNEQPLNQKYANQKFDVIFCGEVVEHLFSPDDLLSEIYKLMHDESILILSTPNLGYYVNRILLLCGISPLFIENSSEKKLGRKFHFLGQGNVTEGHIKVFTYGALVELIKMKGFKIIRTTPYSVWNFFPDKIIQRISKSLASDNVFVLQK